MYIFNISRPAEALRDYHPKGTTVTLDLNYHECVLLDHALHEYEKTHPDMSDDDKHFMWEFITLRDIMKQGGISGFNCAIYDAMFPKENEETVKILQKEDDK